MARDSKPSLPPELPLKPLPEEEPQLGATDYRAGARVFSVVAALAAVGYFFAWGPLQYVLVAIAVVCFIRAVICFRKIDKAD